MDAYGELERALVGWQDAQKPPLDYGNLGYTEDTTYRVKVDGDKQKYYVRYPNGSVGPALHRGRVPPSPDLPVITQTYRDAKNEIVTEIVGTDPARIGSFVGDQDNNADVGPHQHARFSGMEYEISSRLFEELGVRVEAGAQITVKSGRYDYAGTMYWWEDEEPLDLADEAPAAGQHCWCVVCINPLTNPHSLIAITGDPISVTLPLLKSEIVDIDTLDYVPLVAVQLRGTDPSLTEYDFVPLYSLVAKSGGGIGLLDLVFNNAAFLVSGVPLTESGTITIDTPSQLQNRFWAAPVDMDGAPIFRLINAADLPDHTHAKGADLEDLVEARRMEFGLTDQAGGMDVQVNAFWYYHEDGVEYFPGDTISVLTEGPDFVDKHCWTIISLDPDTNDLVVSKSADVDTITPLTLADIVTALETHPYIPLAAMQHTFGQITPAPESEWVDLRNWFGIPSAIPTFDPSSPPDIGDVVPNDIYASFLRILDTANPSAMQQLQIGTGRTADGTAALLMEGDDGATGGFQAYRFGGVNALTQMIHYGSGDITLYRPNNGDFKVQSGGGFLDDLTVQSSGIIKARTGLIVNDGGADVDSWIEGDTDTNLTYWDAGNNRVGFGTNAPGAKVDVLGSVDITQLRARAALSQTAAVFDVLDDGSNPVFQVFNAGGIVAADTIVTPSFGLTTASALTTQYIIRRSSRNALHYFPIGAQEYRVPGVMWTPNAAIAAITATSGTSLSGGEGSFTIKANMWATGRVLRITIDGNMQTNSSGTNRSNLDILVGATTVVSVDTAALTNSLNRPFQWVVNLRCVTVSGSNATLRRTALFISPDLGVCRTDISGGGINVTTTSDQALGIRLYWTGASNSAQIESVAVEWLN